MQVRRQGRRQWQNQQSLTLTAQPLYNQWASNMSGDPTTCHMMTVPFLALHAWLRQVKLPRGPLEARLNVSFGQAPTQHRLRWPRPHPHPNQAPAAQVGQRPAQIMMYVATLLPLRHFLIIPSEVLLHVLEWWKTAPL